MNQILKTVSVGHCVSCDTETQVHEICIKCAIKLGQDNPRWISVNESLPEMYVDCLFTDGKNRSIHCIGSDGRTDWEANMHFKTKPTHWMPLPEPPSVGGF